MIILLQICFYKESSVAFLSQTHTVIFTTLQWNSVQWWPLEDLGAWASVRVMVPGWYWDTQEIPGQRWRMPSRTLGSPWHHLLKENLVLNMLLLHGSFLNCLGSIWRVLEILYVQLGYNQLSQDYYCKMTLLYARTGKGYRKSGDLLLTQCSFCSRWF